MSPCIPEHEYFDCMLSIFTNPFIMRRNIFQDNLSTTIQSTSKKHIHDKLAINVNTRSKLKCSLSQIIQIKLMLQIFCDIIIADILTKVLRVLISFTLCSINEVFWNRDTKIIRIIRAHIEIFLCEMESIHTTVAELHSLQKLKRVLDSSMEKLIEPTLVIRVIDNSIVVRNQP